MTLYEGSRDRYPTTKVGTRPQAGSHREDLNGKKTERDSFLIGRPFGKKPRQSWVTNVTDNMLAPFHQASSQRSLSVIRARHVMSQTPLPQVASQP
jgi:hypothetical protein